MSAAAHPAIPAVRSRLSVWDTETPERMTAEKILIGGALMGREDFIRSLPAVDFAAPEHQRLALAIVEAWQQHGIPEHWMIYLSAYIAKHSGEGILREGPVTSHCLACVKWYDHWLRNEDWQAAIGPIWGHMTERMKGGHHPDPLMSQRKPAPKGEVGE